ncbi:MAG: hypothetical protein NTU47_04060 [Ignavibacteriales bacterium]|nr:hypothetical protein [Ignavibacteriales bacterium]
MYLRNSKTARWFVSLLRIVLSLVVDVALGLRKLIDRELMVTPGKETKDAVQAKLTQKAATTVHESSTMNIPMNGRVIVIDDNITESLPLLKVLSRNHIPFTYYNGRIGELPAKPLSCTRLIFLDIELETAGQNDITKVSKVITVMERLIPRDNGPYFILVWAKDDHLIQLLSERLTLSETLKLCLPLGIISLEKAIYFDSKSDEKGGLEYVEKGNAIEKIEEALDEKLKSLGVFQIFIIWENLVHRSSARIVNGFAIPTSPANVWNENMSAILQRMAKARLGSNVADAVALLKNSLGTFNASFEDVLEVETNRAYSAIDYLRTTDLLFSLIKDKDLYALELNADDLYTLKKNGKTIGNGKNLQKVINNLTEPDKGFCIQMVDLYEQSAQLINTRLHLDTAPSQELLPGNVYEIPPKNGDHKKELLSNYFANPNNKNLDDYTFIELEVSPVCDYAQNKWLKSRVISGLMYHSSDNLDAKTSEAFYRVKPSFLVDGVSISIILDFRLFKSIDLEKARERSVKIRIKSELLGDIVAKLANHVNRPGIVFIE